MVNPTDDPHHYPNTRLQPLAKTNLYYTLCVSPLTPEVNTTVSRPCDCLHSFVNIKCKSTTYLNDSWLILLCKVTNSATAHNHLQQIHAVRRFIKVNQPGDLTVYAIKCLASINDSKRINDSTDYTTISIPSKALLKSITMIALNTLTTDKLV